MIIRPLNWNRSTSLILLILGYSSEKTMTPAFSQSLLIREKEISSNRYMYFSLDSLDVVEIGMSRKVASQQVVIPMFGRVRRSIFQDPLRKSRNAMQVIEVEDMDEFANADARPTKSWMYLRWNLQMGGKYCDYCVKSVEIMSNDGI